MVHLSTEAVRTKSRVIEVRKEYQILAHLGLGDDGREYRSFKTMEALAACKLTLASLRGYRCNDIYAARGEI
jgi:hypothetical protein